MKYTVTITDQFTGQIDWAEKIFSNGFTAGTYTWWRLVGLMLVLLGSLWLFGIVNFGPA